MFERYASLKMLSEARDLPKKLIKSVEGWSYLDLICSALTYIFSNIEVSAYALLQELLWILILVMAFCCF